MNRKFLEETNDLQRCLTYCYLKLATLTQAQGYKENDNRLTEKVRDWLEKIPKSLKDDFQVQQICTNNMNYLNEDFDSIINIYRKELQKNEQNNKVCIGEDAFSYIAHLYARNKNRDEEHRWYNLAVQYFQSHGHICKHTVICFCKLAHFYEKYENMIAAMNVYETLIIYLVEHLPCSFLRTSIKPIGMNIVDHFKKQGDNKRALLVLQDLIDLMLIESVNGEREINEQFKKLIGKCMDAACVVANLAYGKYLEVLLRHKSQPFDSYISDIEPAFRQAISIHQTDKNYCKSIEIHQQYIELLINSTINHESIVAAFKRLAYNFETLRLFDVELDMYTYLGKFIIKYQKNDDRVLAGFVIVRCKFIKMSSGVFHDEAQQMFIPLIKFYRNSFEPHAVYSEYFKSRHATLPRHTVSGIYLSLLELCFQYRSEFYQNHMKKNIDDLRNSSVELAAFITTYRVNYKALILEIFKKYGNQPIVHRSSTQFSSNFEAAIINWLSTVENDRTVYRSQVLHSLLEWHSIDDVCLAKCYAQMGDKQRAASLFDTDVYSDPALRFNSNACRRFLQHVYHQASAEERRKLEHRYQQHFLLVCDSFSDDMYFEILPLE